MNPYILRIFQFLLILANSGVVAANQASVTDQKLAISWEGKALADAAKAPVKSCNVLLYATRAPDMWNPAVTRKYGGFHMSLFGEVSVSKFVACSEKTLKPLNEAINQCWVSYVSGNPSKGIRFWTSGVEGEHTWGPKPCWAKSGELKLSKQGCSHVNSRAAQYLRVAAQSPTSSLLSAFQKCLIEYPALPNDLKKALKNKRKGPQGSGKERFHVTNYYCKGDQKKQCFSTSNSKWLQMVPAGLCLPYAGDVCGQSHEMFPYLAIKEGNNVNRWQCTGIGGNNCFPAP